MDSFGTEAQFNHKIDGTNKNIYGYHNLNLKQYNTMFRMYILVVVLYLLFVCVCVPSPPCIVCVVLMGSLSPPHHKVDVNVWPTRCSTLTFDHLWF